MTIPELVVFAYAIKFLNDPDCTTPDFTDAQVQTLADAVITALGDRINVSGINFTTKEQAAVDALCRALMANKGYAEKKANNIAQGNNIIFTDIVTRIGFKKAKDHTPSARIEGVVEESIGWAHIRMDKLNKKGREAFMIRYAKTTARGVPPASFASGGPELSPIPQVMLEADVIITDDAGIYGYQYINILPATQKAKTVTKKATKKKAALIPVSKSKHPVISNKDALQWGDIIYFNIL